MIKIMRQRNCYQRPGWAIYRSLVKLRCPLRTPFILACGKKASCFSRFRHEHSTTAVFGAVGSGPRSVGLAPGYRALAGRYLSHWPDSGSRSKASELVVFCC